MIAYIHVPFCVSRCNYCAFYSTTLAGEPGSSPVLRDYVDTLLAEIDHHAATYRGETIQSVFFGGGTPSLLPAKAVNVILNRLARGFDFSSKAEITLEANPESLRKKGAAADFLAAGVNRLSIGVQSLDDAALKMLGRAHRSNDSINSLIAAREAGFANINVDLMWGLPGQSMRQWLQTLKDVIRLEPDHVSAYGLTLEPGTPLDAACENGSLVLPPERDQSIMFMQGAALLEASGFLQYEISNFSRMGHQCRHNLGYWEGSSYLGLGPSATSTIGNRRWTSPSAVDLWAERVKNGQLEQQAELLTPKTRALELVMLRLRTARGLRLKAYKDMTGRDFLHDHQRFIQTLHENGLIRIKNGYMSLTRSGMLVSNSIISNLFERIEPTLDDNFKGQALPEPDLEALARPESGEAIPYEWKKGT